MEFIFKFILGYLMILRNCFGNLLAIFVFDHKFWNFCGNSFRNSFSLCLVNPLCFHKISSDNTLWSLSLCIENSFEITLENSFDNSFSSCFKDPHCNNQFVWKLHKKFRSEFVRQFIWKFDIHFWKLLCKFLRLLFWNLFHQFL